MTPFHPDRPIILAESGSAASHPPGSLLAAKKERDGGGSRDGRSQTIGGGNRLELHVPANTTSHVGQLQLAGTPGHRQAGNNGGLYRDIGEPRRDLD